jgi:glutamine synthetase
MAGLDGVLNKLEPGEALDCLEEDHDFLLKGDVFSEDLIETFIDYKRKSEADAIRLRPHPYEFALYYDI